MVNLVPHRGGNRQGRARVVSFAVVALAAGLIYLGREAVLLAIGDYLVTGDPLQPADVIHVIAGEDHRAEYAIALYKRGYGRRLFFTGGWCKVHGYDHGEHAQALALAQGIPREAIATDSALVTSTYSETVQAEGVHRCRQRAGGVRDGGQRSAPHAQGALGSTVGAGESDGGAHGAGAVRGFALPARLVARS